MCGRNSSILHFCRSHFLRITALPFTRSPINTMIDREFPPLLPLPLVIYRHEYVTTFFHFHLSRFEAEL